MNLLPNIIHQDDLNWQSRDVYQETPLGRVRWKTLLSADQTSSSEITMGMAEIPPGERLSMHSHPQAETYYIVEGTGFVVLDGVEHEVKAGSVVFISGDVVHTIGATGDQLLKMVYSFPVDSFEQVQYQYR